MMGSMSAASSSSGSDADVTAGGPLADLMRAVCAGDQDAFSRLYDATAPRVHGLVLRILRDPAQSEEVTQEVFLEIWRTAPRFDPAKGAALGWVLTVAHRKAVDRVRSSEASRRRDADYERGSPEPAHDSTEEIVSARLDGERVRAALSQLTEHQRLAVELAYFGGHTHAEVAERLGIPLGTAKSRIRDGLHRLRDHIGGER